MSNHPQQQKFIRLMLNPVTYKAYLFRKMPIALIAGLRVRAFTLDQCVVSVPFKWLSQNPFRSVYFATQAMAAEMSTGLLCMLATIGKPPVSMLVLHMEADYVKKAAGRVYFTCEDGIAVREAVDQCLATGEGVTFICRSVGKLKDGTIVSNFSITWTFKRKK